MTIKYAVTLFPKEKCQCPATGNCCHILAAKMSIGKPMEERKSNINLQLARNKQKRADKNTGRKKPRKFDSEVTPAPDSKLAEISEITIKSETSKFNLTHELAEDQGQISPTKSILKTPTTKTRKTDVKFKENLIFSDSITSTPKDKRKRRSIARKSSGFDESMMQQNVPQHMNSLLTYLPMTLN